MEIDRVAKCVRLYVCLPEQTGRVVLGSAESAELVNYRLIHGPSVWPKPASRD